jgi:transcriptional regulator with XRE-family HTH domain
MSIENKMRELRKLHGVSQADMSKRLGVGRVTLSEYERGVRHIRVDKLEDYLDELGYELKIVLK